jgi:hypothetical protein
VRLTPDLTATQAVLCWGVGLKLAAAPRFLVAGGAGGGGRGAGGGGSGGDADADADADAAAAMDVDGEGAARAAGAEAEAEAEAETEAEADEESETDGEEEAAPAADPVSEAEPEPEVDGEAFYASLALCRIFLGGHEAAGADLLASLVAMVAPSDAGFSDGDADGKMYAAAALRGLAHKNAANYAAIVAAGAEDVVALMDDDSQEVAPLSPRRRGHLQRELWELQRVMRVVDGGK